MCLSVGVAMVLYGIVAVRFPGFTTKIFSNQRFPTFQKIDGVVEDTVQIDDGEVNPSDRRKKYQRWLGAVSIVFGVAFPLYCFLS